MSTEFNYYYYLLPHIGVCNDCKENEASGCESCHSKRLRFLSDPLLDTTAKEAAMAEVLNTLDSDQEQGPAGGPAVARLGSVSNTSNVEPKSDSPSSTSPSAASNEVYVTPAPFIDHEYSHFQAHLRRPDDNRVVNRFNELYCTQTLRHSLKSNTQFKRFSTSATVHSRANDHDNVEMGFESDGISTSREYDGFSDEFDDTETKFNNDDLPPLSNFSNKSFAFARKRGKPRTGYASGSKNGVPKIARPIPSANSKRSANRDIHPVKSKMARRSKRVGIPSRRSYDARSQDAISKVDHRLSVGTQDSYYLSDDDISADYPVKQYISATTANKLETPSFCRRGRRGRRRGCKQRTGYQRPYTEWPGTNSTKQEGADSGDSTDIEDEEVNYLRHAVRRQQADMEHLVTSSPTKHEYYLGRDTPSPNAIVNGRGRDSTLHGDTDDEDLIHDCR